MGAHAFAEYHGQRIAWIEQTFGGERGISFKCIKVVMCIISRPCIFYPKFYNHTAEWVFLLIFIGHGWYSTEKFKVLVT